MSGDVREIQAIRRRLESLERQNRLLKTAGLCLLALVACSILLAAGRPQPKVLEAQEFRVIDQDRIWRARLAVEKDDAMLGLYDSSEHVRVELTATDRTSELALYDDRGRPRIVGIISEGEEMVTKDMGKVQLPDDVVLTLYDEKGSARTMLQVGADASLTLLDAEGKRVFRAP